MKLVLALLLAGCSLEPCPDDPNTDCIAHDPDPPDIHEHAYEGMADGIAGDDFIALVRERETGKSTTLSLARIDLEGQLVAATPLRLALDSSLPQITGDGATAALVAAHDALHFVVNGTPVHDEPIARPIGVAYANGTYWVEVGGQFRELRRYALNGDLLQTIPSHDARFAGGITTVAGDDISIGMQLVDTDTRVVVDRVHDGAVMTIELARLPNIAEGIWVSSLAVRADGTLAVAAGVYNSESNLVIRAPDGTIQRVPITAAPIRQLVATADGYLGASDNQLHVFDASGALVRSVHGGERNLLVARAGHAMAVSTIDWLSVATHVMDVATDRLQILYRGVRETR